MNRTILSTATLVAIASLPLFSSVQLVHAAVNAVAESDAFQEGRHIDNTDELKRTVPVVADIPQPAAVSYDVANAPEPVEPLKSPFVTVGRFPIHGRGTATPSKRRGIGSASRRGIVGVRHRKSGRK